MLTEDQREQLSTTQLTREPSLLEVAAMIAGQLGEDQEPQRQQLISIVRALGRTQAQALLRETLDIEAQGGMMVPGGSRRRTVGGIFFYLVYSKGQPKEGRKLVRPTYKKQKTGASPVPTPKQTVKPEPVITFRWEDRIAVIQSIVERGIATTVKITLIGRLGKYEDRSTCIVGVMQSGDKVPALPKGVPTPQATKTNYVVYIGSKQWKNVATVANDPEDVFIIEGYPQIDTKTNAISVFATNITSKKLQAAKRQSQPQG
jgi:hypothetical protein